MTKNLATMSMRFNGDSNCALRAEEESVERRRRSRRAGDQRQAALADIAGALANSWVEPMFIVDRNMRVLLVNDAGRQYVRGIASIRMSGQRLVFTDEGSQAQIKRVLLAAAPLSSIPLQVEAVQVSLCVERLACVSPVSAFMITLRARNDRSGLREVRREFGLTLAESQIAMDIFNGATLVKIANKRNASVNTVKTQARSVFQKCSVHSKVELTRLLGEWLAFTT